MTVIERRPMYSNKMMVEYCDTLRKIIMSSTADDKGVVSNKYKSSALINDSIEISYEHYKQLYETQISHK